GLFMKMPNASTFNYAPSLPRNLFYSRIWEDQKGNLLTVANERHWLYARTEAIFLLDEQNEKTDFDFLLYQHNYLLAVASKDFNDVIYAGMDPGFKVIKNNYSTITTYFDVDLNKSSYAPVMRGIVEGDSGIIYTAKESRFWLKINSKTGARDTLQINDEAGNPLYLHCAKNLILQDKYLWGSTCDGETNGYIIRYDTQTGEVKRYFLDYRIDYLLIDSKDRFWIIADRGESTGILLTFNPTTGSYAPYDFQEKINPLANARPLYLYETRDNNIWVGTTNGLYYFNPDTRQYGLYSNKSTSGAKLSSNYIMDIYEDDHGRLMLGTSNGLCILDRTTNEIDCLLKKDGLPNNVVCSILPDYKGNYWLSTFNGLSYFDFNSKLFRNFYASDGLSNNEFNKLSKMRGSDGRFYFGSINGINSFSSEDMLKQNIPPPPLLTKITRFDTVEDTIIEQVSSLVELAELVISPAVGYFQIDFALPKFVNPTKNQFQIKLENLDSDWSYLGNQHSVRYNFLPPGEYILKIKGDDSKGNWSAESRDLKIIVQQ
ncbi:MAG: two-component regulator propeller domain-containing protein, partial [Saprospiraceae bacterium]